MGVTARSNAAGIGQLAAEVEPFGYHVQPVVVQGCLHLKSACSYIGDAVLVHRPWVDEAAFAGVRLVDVPEECGANVLTIGETVLVPARGSANGGIAARDGAAGEAPRQFGADEGRGGAHLLQFDTADLAVTGQEACPTARRRPS